jgi:hypothetical protein
MGKRKPKRDCKLAVGLNERSWLSADCLTQAYERLVPARTCLRRRHRGFDRGGGQSATCSMEVSMAPTDGSPRVEPAGCAHEEL